MSDDKKRMTIAALTEGCSITDAAKRAGVSRQTLSGWVNQDAAFREVLFAERELITQQHRDRVISIEGKMLDLIEERLDLGDTRLLRQLIQSRGLNF